MPEIAQDRAISTLSTRNRENRLQQIRDSANAEDWRRRAWARLEAEQRQYEEEQRCRAEELERLSKLAEYRRYEEKSQQMRDEVEDILRGQTDKVADTPSGRKWLVLGYRRSRAISAPRVVLRCCEDYEDDEDTCVVWETQGIERVLNGCADIFEADTDKFGRTTFRLPPVGDGLEIEIEPARVFQPGDGRKVSWNPIGVVAAPDPQRLATFQALAEKEQEHQVQLEAVERALEQSCLLEATAPNPRAASGKRVRSKCEAWAKRVKSNCKANTKRVRSKRYIGMEKCLSLFRNRCLASAWQVLYRSQGQIEEIRALRGRLSAAEAKKRFGIES